MAAINESMPHVVVGKLQIKADARRAADAAAERFRRGCNCGLWPGLHCAHLNRGQSYRRHRSKRLSNIHVNP
ncbi:MAG: hypothetical protein ABIV92_04615, partial [Thermoflexales bacterium]